MLEERNEKRISIWKVVIVSAAVAMAIFGALLILYKLFKKYFKITFECDDCDCDDGFNDDFDFDCCCSDDDCVPKCDDEDKKQFPDKE